MRNITLWSVLTLLTVLVGGGCTLILDRMELARWGASGIAIPLAQAFEVDLPAGDMLVYYESTESVPTSDVLLALRDDEGTLIWPRNPSDDNSYRLGANGWSGRALWEYRDLPGGAYTAMVTNPHYTSDEQIPIDDRVVFAKDPNSLAGVHARRQRIHFVGIGITLLLAAGFYGVHMWSGRGRS